MLIRDGREQNVNEGMRENRVLTGGRDREREYRVSQGERGRERKYEMQTSFQLEVAFPFWNPLD